MEQFLLTSEKDVQKATNSFFFSHHPVCVWWNCLLSFKHMPPYESFAMHKKCSLYMLEEWNLAILFLCWTSIYEPDLHGLLDMIHYYSKTTNRSKIATCSISMEKEIGALLRARSVSVRSGKPFQIFQAVFFPMPKNLLVESHPVNAWNSGNERLVSGHRHLHSYLYCKHLHSYLYCKFWSVNGYSPYI